MRRGRIIYSDNVEIIGYNGLFKKECRFDLKSKLFNIIYPVKIVSENIISTEYVYKKSLGDAETEWYENVKLFESLSSKYETVILYQIEENGSFRDGSGEGFVFNWGVFRKVINDSSYELVFERAYKDNKISVGFHHLKKEWKEMEWSENAEKFFIELSRQIEEIYNRLDYFVNQVDFRTIDKINLLGK